MAALLRRLSDYRHWSDVDLVGMVGVCVPRDQRSAELYTARLSVELECRVYLVRGLLVVRLSLSLSIITLTDCDRAISTSRVATLMYVY